MYHPIHAIFIQLNTITIKQPPLHSQTEGNSSQVGYRVDTHHILILPSWRIPLLLFIQIIRNHIIIFNTNKLQSVMNPTSNKKRIGKYIIYLNDKLGEGAFSEVFKGIEEETKEEVAIKVVAKAKIQQDQYTKNAFYSEIQIMKRLKSKNIIRFHDVHQTKNNFYIILELAQGGTLRKNLKQCGRLEEKQAMKYLIQILNGFGQLVKNGIIHRDLKPQNILIKDDVLKIGDFGFAKASENNSFMKTIVGTPTYMAPQILAEEKYTYKCDIWALGVILYEFVVGKIPWSFKEKTLPAFLNQIRTSPVTFPQGLDISDNMKQLILGCLCIDEQKRLDWQQIFLHPIFNNKFKANFQNKKEGSTKIAFVMANLRMSIHSKNINMTKIFNKVGQKLSKNDFFNLLRFIYKEISQEDVTLIYQFISRDNFVYTHDFQEFLKKYGCRMTGIDLAKIQSEVMNSNEGEKKRSFVVIARLKNKIDDQNIDIAQLYQKRDQFKKNALSIQQFGKLVYEIDNELTKDEIECLFDEFDVNKDGKISFTEFFTGICKIAEIVAMIPE